VQVAEGVCRGRGGEGGGEGAVSTQQHNKEDHLLAQKELTRQQTLPCLQ